MADLSITAATVVAGANAIINHSTAGEAISAGQAVYFDTTTKKLKLADNDGTAALRVATGIALNGAALNQPLAYAKSGDITIGATLTPGAAYYLSKTAGGICPVADVGEGESVVQLGLAKSATVLALNIQIPGVTL